MYRLAYLLTPVLLLVLFVSSADAGGKKKKKSSSDGTVTGTIVSVEKGTGTNAAATLTVKVDGKKKKTAATDRKFELAKDTKLETLSMGKKQFGLKAAALGDLKAGEKILVLLRQGRADQAERVMVVASGKKKAAAAN
jgi:hypothetical protein